MSHAVAKSVHLNRELFKHPRQQRALRVRADQGLHVGNPRGLSVPFVLPRLLHLVGAGPVQKTLPDESVDNPQRWEVILIAHILCNLLSNIWELVALSPLSPLLSNADELFDNLVGHTKALAFILAIVDRGKKGPQVRQLFDLNWLEAMKVEVKRRNLVVKYFVSHAEVMGRLPIVQSTLVLF